MIRHYYTLSVLIRELSNLRGFSLIDCYTYEKNSLHLVFSDASSLRTFRFSADTSLGGFYELNNFGSPRKNIVHLFQNACGEPLQEISMPNSDRLIKLEFINTVIYLILFGGSKSNVIVTNRQNVIIDAFKRKKELSGQVFSAWGIDTKGNISDSSEVQVPIDLQLGKYYLEELMHLMPRTNSANGETVLANEETVNFDKQIYIDKAVQLRSLCLDSREYYIYKLEKGRYLLSLIPLSNYGEPAKIFRELSHAIDEKVRLTLRDQAFVRLRSKLENFLNRSADKLRTQLDHTREATRNSEKEALLRNKANALLYSEMADQNGMEKIELQDFEGNQLLITLNPALTLKSNAAIYFDKARRAKDEREIREKRLPLIEKKLSNFENLIFELNNIESYKELIKLEEKIESEYRISTPESKPEGEDRFRSFDLGEGFTLYVGKNAANNDELTMHFAKPNDLWFHARGSGGSHTVLRINKNQKPSKQIIKKAAEITAYYSQARKAKYTPVAYTFKKYVHKPKGANTGSVIIDREEVIMVEPKLPAGEKE